MTVLSDADLYRLYPGRATEPASINLCIGDSLLIWPSSERRDPRTDQGDTWLPVPMRQLGGAVWVLHPHFRYLATVREPIKIRTDLVGQIMARSSWGRDGLAVICGPAGYLDPGYEGCPTLELSVIGSDLVLWPGAEIAQLVLHRLETPCERPYGHPTRQSKYQGDSDPTPSKLWQEDRP